MKAMLGFEIVMSTFSRNPISLRLISAPFVFSTRGPEASFTSRPSIVSRS